MLFEIGSISYSGINSFKKLGTFEVALFEKFKRLKGLKRFKELKIVIQLLFHFDFFIFNSFMGLLLSDQTFSKLNSNQVSLEMGDYENCTFKHCDFSNANFSKFKFIDCEFYECNLSVSTISNTSFQDVIFINCKLLGLRFDAANQFGLSLSFENCTLNHSSFYKCRLPKIKMEGCQLQEVDFSEADLSEGVFTGCDLMHATFDQTNLEKADFRTASNFSIDPENNKLKKAKFSANGLAGLLSKYQLQID
jgi:fluoroquinolone resistance protein